jgi:hypothetical protein
MSADLANSSSAAALLRQPVSTSSSAQPAGRQGAPLAWYVCATPLPPPPRFISPGQQLLYGQVSLLIQCIQLIAILIAITLQSQEGSRSHSQTLNAGRELGPFQWWRW